MNIKEIISFFTKESETNLKWLPYMLILAGITNALVLAIISDAAKTATDQEVSYVKLMIYIVIIIIFIFSQRSFLFTGSRMTETSVNRIRKRLSQYLLGTDFKAIESVGKNKIFSTMVNDTNAISFSVGYLLVTVESALMVVFVLIYMAFLSMTLFVFVMGALSAGAFIYRKQIFAFSKSRDTVAMQEGEMFDSLNDSLVGNKELKFNQKKTNALIAFFQNISNVLRGKKTDIAAHYADIYTASLVFFFFLLGFVIFILPKFNLLNNELIIQAVAAVFFIMGPITALASTIPLFNRLQQAIEHVRELESFFKENADPCDAYIPDRKEFKDFNCVRIDTLTYMYPSKTDDRIFTLGPIDLEIKKGELLCIVGGNGSGKTTFIKLLTGLYQPDSGDIFIDDIPVQKDTYSSYREMFSAIFTDYHLFAKLYGDVSIDMKTVRQLLRLMQLDKKVTFEKDQFSTTKLSTGQRKRLALIVSLLEDKPIYVYDEWAADQDPEFRKYYYEEILPDLKAKGKTIIIISHDDRYFSVADKIVTMEYGRIRDIRNNR